MDIGGGCDRVDAALGHGAVAAAALNGDLEVVDAGHRLLAPGHGPERCLREHMHGKGGVWARVFQSALGHACRSAARCLLAGLEQQLHAALQFALVTFEELGGT